MVVGPAASTSLSHRIFLEILAISGALLISIVILVIFTGRTFGQLLPIHLWTAMLPVYFSFTFITSVQLLRRPKAVVQPTDECLTKIQAMLRGERVILDVNEVDFFSSESHETVAYAGSKEYICALPLSRLSQRLDPRMFLRSHRSYLVNLAKVTSLTAEADELKTASGRSALVSKRNRSQLRRMLKVMST